MSGDRRAFDDLIRPRMKKALHYAERITGSWAGAQEACQMALWGCWGAMAITRTYDSSKGCFDAYLMNSVRNKAFSWLRGERRHGGTDATTEPEKPTEGSALSPEELWCLRDAIDELPKEHQEIIQLLHYHCLKQEEVAQRLGIAPGTVKSRHSRALENLREIFRKMNEDQEGVSPSRQPKGRTRVRSPRTSKIPDSRDTITDPVLRRPELLKPMRSARSRPQQRPSQGESTLTPPVSDEVVA